MTVGMSCAAAERPREALARNVQSGFRDNSQGCCNRLLFGKSQTESAFF